MEAPLSLQFVDSQFVEAYRHALTCPEVANIVALWQLVERMLPGLSEAEQLQIAGTVLVQLAELHASKADRLLGDWQDQHNDDGPVLEEDLLAGLIQRTMYLDLAELVKTRQRSRAAAPNSTVSRPDKSVAGVVDKQKVLEMVTALEATEVEKQQALGVAHDENVTAWSQAIADWMSQQEQPIAFLELIRALKMPLVKVWLALLLGNFALESRGEFYAADQIWVRCLANSLTEGGSKIAAQSGDSE